MRALARRLAPLQSLEFGSYADLKRKWNPRRLGIRTIPNVHMVAHHVMMETKELIEEEKFYDILGHCGAVAGPADRHRRNELDEEHTYESFLLFLAEVAEEEAENSERKNDG